MTSPIVLTQGSNSQECSDNYIFIKGVTTNEVGIVTAVDVEVSSVFQSNSKPYNIKRYICLPYDAADEFPYIKDFITEQQVPEGYGVILDKHNRVCVKIGRGEIPNITEDVHIPVDLIFEANLQFHLEHIINPALKEQTSGGPINDKDMVVVTYPAKFSTSPRRLTIFNDIVRRVFKISREVVTLPESSSAAIATIATMEHSDGTAVVIDVGSHTTQVAAVAKRNRVLKEFISYVEYVGSVNYDAKIRQAIYDGMRDDITLKFFDEIKTTKDKLFENHIFTQALYELIEEIKSKMSKLISNCDSNEHIRDINIGLTKFGQFEVSPVVTVTYGNLEKYTKEIDESITHEVRAGLEKVKIKMKDMMIQDDSNLYIVVIGGTVQWPAVKDQLPSMVKYMFNGYNYQQGGITFGNRLTVVRGAALYGINLVAHRMKSELHSEELPPALNSTQSILIEEEHISFTAPSSSLSCRNTREVTPNTTPFTLTRTLEFDIGFFIQTNDSQIEPEILVSKGTTFPMTEYSATDYTIYFPYDVKEPFVALFARPRDGKKVALITFIDIMRGSSELWADENDTFFQSTQLSNDSTLYYNQYTKKDMLKYSYEHLDMCKHMFISIKVNEDPTRNISVRIRTPIREWSTDDLEIQPQLLSEDAASTYDTIDDLIAAYNSKKSGLKIINTREQGKLHTYDSMQILNEEHKKRMEIVEKEMREDCKRIKQRGTAKRLVMQLMSKDKVSRSRDFKKYIENHDFDSDHEMKESVPSKRNTHKRKRESTLADTDENKEEESGAVSNARILKRSAARTKQMKATESSIDENDNEKCTKRKRTSPASTSDAQSFSIVNLSADETTEEATGGSSKQKERTRTLSSETVYSTPSTCVLLRATSMMTAYDVFEHEEREARIRKGKAYYLTDEQIINLWNKKVKDQELGKFYELKASELNAMHK
jgi:hypothetical protein